MSAAAPRLLPITLGVMLMLCGTSISAQADGGAVSLDDPVAVGQEFGFTANYPRVPQPVVQHVKTFDILVYLLSLGDGTGYVTAVRDIGPGPASLDDSCALEANIPPSQVLRSVTAITIDGNPGCDVVSDDPTAHQITHARNFIHAKRLYRALLMVPEGHENDANNLAFLDSFHVFDPGKPLAAIPSSTVAPVAPPSAPGEAFVAKAYGFSAVFPVPPAYGENGTGIVQFYILNADGRFYGVTVKDNTPTLNHAPEDARAKTMDETIAKIVQEAHGTARAVLSIVAEGSKGREAIIDAPDKTWRARVLMTDRHIYEIFFYSNKAEETGSQGTAFINSFHLLPDAAARK